MATNLKGKGRFVSLLLLHGEKIAIGVVGLVALWFVYKSLKIDKLDDKFQADKLQSEITQTSTEIKDYTWDKAAADDPKNVKKFQATTATKDLSIKFEDYVPQSFELENSIVAPLILRE